MKELTCARFFWRGWISLVNWGFPLWKGLLLNGTPDSNPTRTQTTNLPIGLIGWIKNLCDMRCFFPVPPRKGTLKFSITLVFLGFVPPTCGRKKAAMIFNAPNRWWKIPVTLVNPIQQIGGFIGNRNCLLKKRIFHQKTPGWWTSYLGKIPRLTNIFQWGRKPSTRPSISMAKLDKTCLIPKRHNSPDGSFLEFFCRFLWNRNR